MKMFEADIKKAYEAWENTNKQDEMSFEARRERLKKDCVSLYAEAQGLPAKKDMAKILWECESLSDRCVFGDLGGRFETRHSLALKIVIVYLLNRI